MDMLVLLCACLLVWLIGCLVLHQRCRHHGPAGARAAVVLGLAGSVAVAAVLTPSGLLTLPLWFACAVIALIHVRSEAARVTRRRVRTQVRRPLRRTL